MAAATAAAVANSNFGKINLPTTTTTTQQKFIAHFLQTTPCTDLEASATSALASGALRAYCDAKISHLQPNVL